MAKMVELKDVCKYFGEFKALDNVSFSIEEGEVVGFLGPNGAGKTTTMRIITCFMEQTSGKVTVGGYDNLDNPEEVKSLIGYLPEHPPIYNELSVEEYLYFVAAIRKLNKNKIKSRIDDVIEMIGLKEKRNFLIGHLSKGYRQRVGIAQAIIHEPKLLILDEPTIGLDPIQILEVRQVLKELAKHEHRTIILSTHILQEVTAICSRAVIINKGKIVNDIVLSHDNSASYVITLKGDIQKAINTIKSSANVLEVKQNDQDSILVTFNLGSDPREEIVKLLVTNNLVPIEIKPSQVAIERIFAESVYS